MESKYGAQNSVSSENQLPENEYSTVHKDDGETKVLFIGNSITLHGIAPHIGWHGYWGMAASAREKDYVHLVVEALKKHNRIDFSIAQCARWEMDYTNTDSILNEHYTAGRDFDADVIIVRIGENIKISTDEDTCRLHFEKMISFFNKSGKARILITGLFWDKPVLNGIIKDIASDNGYVYCDITDLEKDKRTMALGQFEHKGICVHPSDFGMKCIADRILESLKEFDLLKGI